MAYGGECCAMTSTSGTTIRWSPSSKSSGQVLYHLIRVLGSAAKHEDFYFKLPVFKLANLQSMMTTGFFSSELGMA